MYSLLFGERRDIVIVQYAPVAHLNDPQRKVEQILDDVRLSTDGLGNYSADVVKLAGAHHDAPLGECSADDAEEIGGLGFRFRPLGDGRWGAPLRPDPHDEPLTDPRERLAVESEPGLGDVHGREPPSNL